MLTPSEITVGKVMTPLPHTIQAHQTVGEAWRLLTDNGVRHLPVLQGDKVVGILSQRDLYRLETVTAVDRNRDPVADAMTRHPYCVPTDTPLAQVVQTMARSRFGAALVVEDGVLVGIYTCVDALHTLARLLAAGPQRLAS